MTELLFAVLVVAAVVSALWLAWFVIETGQYDD